MIQEKDLTDVGMLFKPHGIKGELNAELDYELTPDDLRCVIIEIDGIYTPFFIDSFRTKGADRWLLKFKGIDDERAAASLVNHHMYAVTAELPFDTTDDEEGVHLYDLVGYTLFDNDVEVGKIDAVDDTTANILLIVTTPHHGTVYVPFVEDFLMAVEPARQRIVMNIPEGVLNLNGSTHGKK